MRLFAFVVMSHLLTSGGFTGATQSSVEREVVVSITATDDLRFTPDLVEVPRGSRVVVRLTTVSVVPKIAMAHNFVLLKRAGDADEMARLSNATPPLEYSEAIFRGRVLAATPFAGAGETVETRFTAPRRPGRYVFICTYLGHYKGGMVGVLVVK